MLFFLSGRNHCALLLHLFLAHILLFCWIHRGKDWAEVELAQDSIIFATYVLGRVESVANSSQRDDENECISTLASRDA